MKEENITRYKPEDLPEPSQEELECIDAIKDDEINFSDIPELTTEFIKTESSDFKEFRLNSVT